MEIDGICFDPYAKAFEKRKAPSSQQYIPESVSQASAPGRCDGEYWDAMCDMHTSGGGKKMKMTTKSSRLPSQDEGKTQARSTDEWGGQTRSTHTKKEKKVKRGVYSTGNHYVGKLTFLTPRTRLPSGSEEHPVATHDPALFKAVEILSENLTRLLAELQSTFDAAAAEPILAAVAAITLEVTKMRHCEERAMMRMLEIEEHRMQITQGLLGYEQRKAMRERSEHSE
ncbi:hypothetical protein BBJ28_00004472 [Nothophytophthora sp. Chile5]|nr:hypothetical protein BBJ28_00004472 [Nothophytophthora sp. Chile5]